MLKSCTEVVFKVLGYVEAGRGFHIDHVCCEAITKSNTLMKFDRNSKRLRGRK